METVIEIVQKAAFNLGILGDDGITINSERINKAGLKLQLNNIYRYSIGQILLNKYPQDFLQFTYPKSTYTVSFIVGATSSGTTLISTAESFANGIEGRKIHNLTTNEKLEVETWVSTTEVILKTVPTSSWSGNTCYILDNEWAFSSVDLLDVNALVRVDLKYLSTETEFQRAEFVDITDFLQIESRFFTKAAPKFYETSIKEGGIQRRGFGILPYPEAYNGKFRLVYTQLPKKLVNDNDIPQNITMGLPLLLEYGITEWGAGLLGDKELRDEYKTRFNELYTIQVTNYKPRSKATSNQAWGRMYINALETHDI